MNSKLEFQAQPLEPCRCCSLKPRRGWFRTMIKAAKHNLQHLCFRAYRPVCSHTVSATADEGFGVFGSGTSYAIRFV